MWKKYLDRGKLPVYCKCMHKLFRFGQWKTSWKIEFKLEIASRCKLSKFPVKCRLTTSKLCKKFQKRGNRLESAEKYSKVYAELNLNNFWLFQIRISRIYSSNVHTLCKFFETNISYPWLNDLIMNILKLFKGIWIIFGCLRQKYPKCIQDTFMIYPNALMWVHINNITRNILKILKKYT